MTEFVDPLWFTPQSTLLVTTQVDPTARGFPLLSKFVFLSTQPPPSITHLSRLQEPVFFRFRWMVGRGEIVFVCLCSSRTGEGKEVFRDFDLEMSAAHFFGANNIQYYTGFLPPSHIASQRAQLSTFAFALLHLSSRTL